MSKALYLPLSIGYEEEGQEGYTTASQVLGSRNAIEFMNSSLSTIQTFFARMIQLDPEENELFGETGREVNGFRLTTEDEPPGLDHDTAISIRSDHISALGIQSGKESTSDSLLCMGTWDSTTGTWGVNGALRIDMSDGSSFSMESLYGVFKFNNIGPASEVPVTLFSPQPAAILDGVNALVLNNRPGSKLPEECEDGAGIYAHGGKLYAFDSSGVATKLTP